MDEIDEIFRVNLERKRMGGVELDIFVSDGIWLGGMFESRKHEPFIAIGPSNWDSEDELTFLKSESEVEAFIKKLRVCSSLAFGEPNTR